MYDKYYTFDRKVCESKFNNLKMLQNLESRIEASETQEYTRQDFYELKYLWNNFKPSRVEEKTVESEEYGKFKMKKYFYSKEAMLDGIVNARTAQIQDLKELYLAGSKWGRDLTKEIKEQIATIEKRLNEYLTCMDLLQNIAKFEEKTPEEFFELDKVYKGFVKYANAIKNFTAE